MVRPLDGSGISQGREFQMTTTREEKKTATHAAADTKLTLPPNTFEGKIVSVKGGKLVMKNQEGKEYSHTLAKDAKVCCDGTACQTDDLKVGSRIRVTTKKDDRNVATGVESLNKQTEFAQCG